LRDVKFRFEDKAGAEELVPNVEFNLFLFFSSPFPLKTIDAESVRLLARSKE